MSDPQAHGHGASAADAIAALLVEGLRRTNDRVEALQTTMLELESARADARREDANRFADKIERLGERIFAQMDTYHRETQSKLVEVCDKGGRDHALFIQNDLDRKGEIIELQHRLDRDEARERGRSEMRGSIMRAGAWAVEHSKGIAAVAASLLLGVGIGSVDFKDQDGAHAETASAQTTATIPPVTNQQQTLSQSPVEDWPLRTFTDGSN